VTIEKEIEVEWMPRKTCSKIQESPKTDFWESIFVSDLLSLEKFQLFALRSLVIVKKIERMIELEIEVVYPIEKRTME
jgi:hypothetical protein